MIVADTSALIPWLRIGRPELLRSLYRRILITPAVLRELTEQPWLGSEKVKEALGSWIAVKEISVPDDEDLRELEKGDREVIALAEKLKAPLLANDKALILIARSRGVEARWVTTALLELVKKRIVTKPDAKKILFDLLQSGMRLRAEVYAALEAEIYHL
jgi:predicted nucleic acid-binding protein